MWHRKTYIVDGKWNKPKGSNSESMLNRLFTGGDSNYWKSLLDLTVQLRLLKQEVVRTQDKLTSYQMHTIKDTSDHPSIRTSSHYVTILPRLSHAHSCFRTYLYVAAITTLLFQVKLFIASFLFEPALGANLTTASIWGFWRSIIKSYGSSLRL